MVSIIVKQNVKLMISSEEEGMRRFANTESMGGNASSHKGRVCIGVNFRFEPNTGKMVEFTNEGDTTLSQGRFRLEMLGNMLDIKKYNPAEKKYPRIISYEIILESGWSEQASAEAEAVVQESMKLYNQCCDALERKSIFNWSNYE